MLNRRDILALLCFSLILFEVRQYMHCTHVTGGSYQNLFLYKIDIVGTLSPTKPCKSPNPNHQNHTATMRPFSLLITLLAGLAAAQSIIDTDTDTGTTTVTSTDVSTETAPTTDVTTILTVESTTTTMTPSVTVVSPTSTSTATVTATVVPVAGANAVDVQGPLAGLAAAVCAVGLALL